jgi:hypothetical protein
LKKRLATSDKIFANNTHDMGFYICYCRAHSSLRTLLDPENLCYDYVSDSQTNNAISVVISLSIVVMNSIIKNLNTILIDRIGYDTKSEKMEMIMVTVFLAQLINLMISAVLATANFSEWFPFMKFTSK